MQGKFAIKKSCILGIIFLIVLGLIFPSASSDDYEHLTDPEDGVYTDDFSDNPNLELTNCMLDDDKITLNQIAGGREYDFAEQNFKHLAYAYQTLIPFRQAISFWFSPDSHTNRESKFNERDYNQLEDIDGEYVERSSRSIKKYGLFCKNSFT